MMPSNTLRAAVLVEARQWIKTMAEDLAARENDSMRKPDDSGALKLSGGMWEPWTGDGSDGGRCEVVLDAATARRLPPVLDVLIEVVLAELDVETGTGHRRLAATAILMAFNDAIDEVSRVAHKEGLEPVAGLSVQQNEIIAGILEELACVALQVSR